MFRKSLISSLVFGHVLFAALTNSAAHAGSEELAARKYAKNYIRPKSVPYPSGNQFSVARADLGRALFFDPRLSASEWISCATCHNPALAWGDGLAKGIGHGMKPLGRRSPTILNLAWGELLFWDGRADSLEAQALGPIQSTGEMNLPIEKMVGRLATLKAYEPMFEKAYPGEGITEKTVAKAIATYERTIVSGEAPFDKWVKGQKAALSDGAKRGFVLFNEKAQCATCHGGWRFTDDGFHDIGVADDDEGRGKILPDIPVLKFAFKTPTLRNVDRRAPYLHNGSEATLSDVVEFYNVGGKASRKERADGIMPLNLSPNEKSDLVAFLETLTSKDADTIVPILPR